MAAPSVDIVVFAHNHEQFIEQTVESIAKQDYAGAIRVRVHDDCSTDSTVQIAKRSLIATGLTHEIHVSPFNRYPSGRMFKWNFINESTGDYIAILDGDDFWTDPTKLRRQIFLLESLPEAALCHHAFSSIGPDGQEVSFRPPEAFCAQQLPGSMLSDHNFIGTSTVVLKASLLPRTIPEGYDTCKVDDYPLWALVSSGKSIAFVDRDMSRYRLHGSQHYANQSALDQMEQLMDTLVFIANSVPTLERRGWIDQLERAGEKLSRARRSRWSLIRSCVRAALGGIRPW